MTEDEQNSGGAGLPGGKGLAKKFWWAPFAAVFVFLLAGGYIAMVSMRQSAHKLAGGDDFDKIAANRAVYDGKVAAGVNDTFPVSSAEGELGGGQQAPSAERSHLMPMLAGKSGVLVGDASPAVQAGGETAEGGGAQAAAGPGAAGSAPGGSGTMAARLQGMGSSLGRPGAKGAQGAKPIGFRADGSVAGVTGGGSQQKGAGQAKAARGSMLDSLKSAFRASVYGARNASEDSAKNWTARSFDGTGAASTTLEYSDEMRKELDMVDPNSIPGFLRDQDISAEGAGRLGTSEVSRPDVDKDAMKAAADRAKEESGNDLATQFFSGMMNTMFKGLSPETSPKTPPAQNQGGGSGPDDMSLLSDPKADNSNCQAGCADEFGYVSYGPPGGFQTVFDADGNQVGCTDNAAGFSIPFGAPGCP